MIHIGNSLTPLDNGRRREIGPLDVRHQLIDSNLRIINHRTKTIYHFSQVVRRNICRHTDSNTVGTVHQKIGDTGGKNKRFLQRTVIVRHEIHRIFINITEHFHRNL